MPLYERISYEQIEQRDLKVLIPLSIPKGRISPIWDSISDEIRRKKIFFDFY